MLLYNLISTIYCSPLWDNCGIGFKDRLQKYQNQASRVITVATYDIRSSDLLEKLNWTSLEERRKYPPSSAEAKAFQASVGKYWLA